MHAKQIILKCAKVGIFIPIGETGFEGAESSSAQSFVGGGNESQHLDPFDNQFLP